MTSNTFFNELTRGLAVGVCFCGFCSQAAAADQPAQATDNTATSTVSTQSNGMVSLIEVAPELYYMAKRYNTFYGDANTVQGDLLERSTLLGNAGGGRDYLTDHGFYFDFGVTQFLQGNASGGSETKTRNSGSADAWLWIDTAKAGLWPGGAVFMHGEGQWAQNVNWNFNKDTGSMIPANIDETMPGADWALSEIYLIQALSANYMFAVGKIDIAAWADTNIFANQERTQFTYAGLVTNPIAGSFLPYTSLSAWLNWTDGEAQTLTAVYSQAEGSATVTGFDTLFNGNDTYALQYKYDTEFFGKQAHYLLAVAYSTKDIANFDISRRHFIGEITGQLPVDEKTDNYAVFANFAQYLWVEKDHAEATRHNLPPVGIGLFGRFGWAPEDRNVITQFYSLGIGGYGMLIPGRDGDQWGVGWAGSKISSDLRDFPVNMRSWENAGEAFYNFMLTPAAHLTLDAQVINQAIDNQDTAWTLGARLQLDF